MDENSKKLKGGSMSVDLEADKELVLFENSKIRR